MLTRLIGGNRVITLGTAIEQHFLTNTKLGNGFNHWRGLDFSHALDYVDDERGRNNEEIYKCLLNHCLPRAFIYPFFISFSMPLMLEVI